MAMGAFPKAKKIVWLRNPIFRIISEYYYVVSYPKEYWEQMPGGELNKQIMEEKLSIENYLY